MKEENQALTLYAEMFKEILDLPEVQKSRGVLEGQSIVEIVKHALERQFVLGTLKVYEDDDKYWDDERN